MSTVLKDLKKLFKDEPVYSMADDQNPYKITELVPVDCYILNALMCEGDIFGGVPKGKRITFAGESSTGKSLLCAYITKNYLESVPTAQLIAFETEGASFYDMMVSIGIDKNRVTILPCNTVEQFRHYSTKLLDHIKEEEAERQLALTKLNKALAAVKKLKKENESKEAKIQKVLDQIEEIGPKKEYVFLLDSLGMLATGKETADALSGSTKADMTRAKIIRSIFRIITMDLFITQTPFFVVNHTYDTMDQYSGPQMSGGGGISYASDVTLMLSKAKAKEGTEHIGAIISLRVHKSRFMPENIKAKVMVLFKKGIQEFSWLLEIGKELGVIEMEGIKYTINGVTKTKKEIMANPKKFFSKPALNILQKAIAEVWSFGKSDDVEIEELSEEELEAIELDELTKEKKE